MGEQKESTLIIKIEWADLDLFGHVNNVAFFRYMQSARVHFCEELGLSSIHEDQPSFMVASSQCDFKMPLRYPGEIIIRTKALWIKNTSFKLRHQIIDTLGNLCATGEDVLVVYDHRKKTKMPISGTLRASITAFE